ncbi:MAG TPA: hypothetical protein VIO61_16900 [Anaerolineaceae bacterium]
MNLNGSVYLALPLILATSISLLLARDWKWNAVAYSLQCLGSFWLILPSLPIGLAAVELVVGWVAGVVLISAQSRREEAEAPFLSMQVFRGVAAGMGAILVVSILPGIAAVLPVRIDILGGGLLLIVMGLLMMGMGRIIVRTFFGLLTLVTGFNVIYAALESSLLVIGLRVSITLGLAFVGVYLTLSGPAERGNE